MVYLCLWRQETIAKMEKVYLITEAQMKALMIETIDEYRRLGEANGIQNDDDEYLSSKQVCEELGISTRTFQRYRDEHRIAFIQRGRKIYVKRSDFNAFQEANRIEAR